MPDFLTGKALTDCIYNIIWEAEEQLIIVSPFIKLDNYFKTLFEKHKHNHKLEILIMFGKNEASPNKSLNQTDFDFFKQFKNITVVYCPPLHGKYYCNERQGALCSTNMYDTNFEHNIEFGVSYKLDIWDEFRKSVDTQAYEYIQDLKKQHPVVFVQRPVYESSLLSSITGKRYIESKTMYDATDKIGKKYQWDKEPKRFFTEFPQSVDMKDNNDKRPERHEVISQVQTSAATKEIKINSAPNEGYCIRTGVSIKFSMEKPMSYESYKKWAMFGNPDFEERYCHKCGKSAPTSMRKPLCYSCFKAI